MRTRQHSQRRTGVAVKQDGDASDKTHRLFCIPARDVLLSAVRKESAEVTENPGSDKNGAEVLFWPDNPVPNNELA
ncbi:MAG: hypothetical protein E7268_05150 [Lachnospiraceae bacterium]|nr:hypothetical protein [Lachnospiraceae bacterium]